MNDRKFMLACIWCGPLMALLFGIGFFPVAGFLPPPSPDDTAAQTVAWFDDNLNGIRWGTVIMMAGTPLIAPWGIALAALTYRTERGRGFPVVTSIQIMCAGIVVFTIALFTLIWAVAAFRIDETSPETTQALNDIAYFLLLFDWSPFCLWVASFAVAILRDQSDTPIFPRWAAYLNLWIVGLSVPGCLIVFFKDGPFAYDGFVAFYFPVVVFFIWLVTMTTLAIRALNRDDVSGVPAA